MTQREKAEELRRLHAAPEPLVLVNAWDAVSARVVADAGARGAGRWPPPAVTATASRSRSTR